MMHTWFEGKIRYEKVAENGMNKKVTEPYLVDALSFTEAEARLIEEVTPFITGEFTVIDIKRANYSEIFPSDEKLPTSGTNASCTLSPSTRKAVQKRRQPPTFWYRLPTFEMR